ncbi:trypsin-7-like isoform X2 [Cataglyphis hispanica]|uniref:trypsin-7-like isoform X2 n=2 Tax=Cataglyphis hispanica TaxID=1086592 RepID=UPI002180451A|nr:trypsin-7-like isoform X2 [Cataglyphis hispanica]
MTLTLLSLISFLAISHGALIKLDPRIVGGRNAKPGEIPYQVSLQIIETGHHFCGGVVLNQKYVLTAAHCVFGKNVSLISATVGTTDLRKPHAVHFIESSYVHKEYDENNSWFNDIALLKLKTPFKFSTLISPVVLPEQNQIVKTNSIAIVSGYGRLWYNGNKTTELHVANIKVADQAYCRYMYEKHSKNIFDTAHICANEPTVERGSCKGDSGGPLTVDGKLVGLVSWSYRCSDTVYPSVYTRVPSYVNWIEKYAV